uniref:Uncharacterized protein n=1 Tax=Arundo donax TaxID=35708 RepID=A0A0A9ASA7_ARUDO
MEIKPEKKLNTHSCKFVCDIWERSHPIHYSQNKRNIVHLLSTIDE